jgi:small subunit ribosomal protein S7
MRGKKAPKRNIIPDPKFNRVDVNKFVNQVMRKGKKTIAQKIVYGAFDIVKAKSKQEPLLIFDEAVKKIAPQMEVRTRRIGGAHYQIPFPVRGDRQKTLAYRWIIRAAKSRKGKPMHEKLAEEILNAAKGEGVAIKKREDVHKMAEANKAFAHFAKFG